MLLPGVLPTPHASMTWEGPRLVRLVDIPLPPPPPSRTRAATTTPSPVATIPLTAPDGIAPEREAPTQADATNDTGSVVPGIDLGSASGNFVEPPPPPTPAPGGPIRMHLGVDQPRKVHDVVPVYPALARAAGARGVVIIEATIDARGDVVATKVLRSVPLLDEAAVEAVRQWKYTPARLNGEPVAVLMTVTVNFTLGAR
jgi:protein TonB